MAVGMDRGGSDPQPGGEPNVLLTSSRKNVVLTEAGRAPWYDSDGRSRPAYVIGVAGGSASGKTSVARRVLARLPNVAWVAIVSQDSFYKPLGTEQSALAFQNKYNFDHPTSFDQELFRKCIADLKACRAVELPVYSFVQHQRTEEKVYLYGASVIIVEGLFVLNDPGVRDLLDLKIFVQADSDLMLARRIIRDTKERGRDVHGIIDHYLRWVKPAMDNHINPDSKWADLIVPGQNNEVAVDVVAQHLKRQLDSRAQHIRSELGQMATNEPHNLIDRDTMMKQQDMTRFPSPMSRTSSQAKVYDGGSAAPTHPSSPLVPNHTNNLSAATLPKSVHLLEPTPQALGLLTLLHDTATTPEDFIFYTNRLSSLIVETALSVLPYKERKVRCAGSGAAWTGKSLDVENVCSVSILRSGGVLERAARRAIPAISQGSLLIQSSEDDGEPHLYSIHFPSTLRSRQQAGKASVLLLDAQISTGSSAFMAIRVLLDHGVLERNIIFLSIIASPKGGIWALTKAFPHVKIVLGCIDSGLRKITIDLPSEGDESSADRPVHSNTGATGAREVPESSRSQTRSKVIWCITPGAGNLGDRYFRTDTQ